MAEQQAGEGVRGRDDAGRALKRRGLIAGAAALVAGIAAKRGDGFVVEEQQGGTGSGSFSYRVVARRADVAAGRLATFALVGKEKHETTPPQTPPPLTIPKEAPKKP